MNYQITQNETYSLGVVPTTDLGIVIASITIDLHTDNTLHEQGLHLLYPDALLSGAGKLSRESFLSAINLLGAEIITNITEGRLTITIRSTTAVFSKILALTKIMLVEPTFAPTELKRIKTTVTNELHVKQEQTAVIAREQLRNSFYSQNDRRYTADTPSLIQELPVINSKTLHLYHKEIFTKRWTCTIASDAKCVQSFERLLKEVRKGNKVIPGSTTHEQLPIHRSLVLKNVPSRTNIDFSIGIPVPITIHHDDFVPLSFALGVLGIPGFAGRLMSTVREQEGLTYGIYAYPESFSGIEQGYARVMTFFTPEKSLRGLTSTFREIKKFHQRGVTEAEFEVFKNIFKTKQTLLQDSPFKQLSDLHTFNQNGFSVEEIKNFKDKLNKITRDQVNTVIKKYLAPSQFTISGAGPTKTVEKEIASFFAGLK